MIRVVGLLALCVMAGCTPTRHRIPPPFPYQGGTYEAEEIGRIAEDYCRGQPHGEVPPNDFSTDGCSLWPDGSYRECCVEHDVRYWCAGATDQRRPADRLLRDCVAAHSTEFNALLMYWGVRLGGNRVLPFPWRWGYGHPWIYSPPSPEPESRAR